MAINDSSWENQIEDIITSGSISLIIIYGNIRDLYFTENGPARLQDYLFEKHFNKSNYRISYDPQSGIQFMEKSQREEFFRNLEGYDAYHGTQFSKSPPKDPVPAFSILENWARIKIMDQKSTVCVIQYAEHLVPAAEAGRISNETRFLLVSLDKWSHDPLFLQNGVIFVLITENLTLLHPDLTRNPHVAHIRIPHPDMNARQKYIEELKSKQPQATDLSPQAMASLTSGLSLVQIKRMFQSMDRPGEKIDPALLKKYKKEYIEAECTGLLEFVEPTWTLDNVAGHEGAREMLRNTAKMLKAGTTNYLPMGYLICGPVGTGKTFIVSCFAGEAGIPVVKFLNFRSQWQGASEANLEKIINLLKSAWPVAVMIDEADAFLGDRNQQGDSGTSSRIFASLATFMSDTAYRGKIIWFLMTSRPDFLPVDMKRQGRAEEHIALFHPQNSDEEEVLFKALASKNKISVEGIKFSSAHLKDTLLSGADIEAILVRAALLSQVKGEIKLSQESLVTATSDFRSPYYPIEMELQILLAIRECTSEKLIPKKYRNQSSEDITSRINQLKGLLGENLS